MKTQQSLYPKLLESNNKSFTSSKLLSSIPQLD